MKRIRSAYRRILPESTRAWIRRALVTPMKHRVRRAARRRSIEHVEPHLRSLMRAFLSPGDIYVDVGANNGALAVEAARILGPEGRVMCFEPEGSNYRRLVRQMSSYPLQKDLWQCAVGGREGTVNLYLSFWDTLHSTVAGINGPHTRRIEVPMVTLDSHIEAHQPAPRLIKIDVEGAELDVLQGAQRLLESQHVPGILCEIANPLAEGMSDNPFQVANLLSSYGYQGWVVDNEFVAPWSPSVCYWRQDVLFLQGHGVAEVLKALEAHGITVHRSLTHEIDTALLGRRPHLVAGIPGGASQAGSRPLQDVRERDQPKKRW